jgi:phage baseplate assembly protein V
MSAARHQNHMRMQAALAAGKVGKPKGGLVTDYDPVAYAVKVMLQPEGIETGWLAIETAMAGNGFGIFAGPINGAQAVVSFLEGDREVGWCTGFLPSDVDVPPHVPAGEIWVVHQSGSSEKFTNDGKVTVTDKSGSVLVMNGDHTGSMTFSGGLAINANTTITGTLHITDEVTADKSVTAATDVVGGGKHLKTHIHSGVTAGGGNTGAPV